MQYKGVCLGAATLSIVTVEKKGDSPVIVDAVVRNHEGEPWRTLSKMLEGLEKARLCATGRKFRHLMTVPSISEPEAVEMAYQFSRRGEHVEAIVSAGSETFILYELDEDGRISNVHTGSKCASGTGEFFLQQIQRMGLNIDEALQEAAACSNPYPVAGRCSVFCKSDCTHALNKGEKKGRVVAGLCQMLAGKVLELVRKAQVSRIMLVGGTSQNSVMVNYLRSEINVIVPPEAPYFEALGTALWAMEQKLEPVDTRSETLFTPFKSSFSFLPPLSESQERVSFKEILRDEAMPGDRLLLGLDVGSTTTKAVLIREEDKALVASIYLRTMGDPVWASRQCYSALSRQVPDEVEIIGLGVTGSGRQIAGMHALTEGVINEIVAHATAALYFDPEVDTIFEIGGQDAKYTYIIKGVPADYAMNEACSAGTGSFLEEAAGEALEVETTSIAPLALKATAPPNFNDQCAAFISSDIKTAVQEGIGTKDILAGLVYSICLNYLTRVKGSRPEGRKIFMQGGVCYNHAVPVAMAGLLDREIVVPPEPGLMGAFGVALEINEKIKLGLLKEGRFDLAELAAREIEQDRSFTCRGDESCDRRCDIRMLRIKGKRYPFGGACSRYTGIQRQEKHNAGALDLVYSREKLIFGQDAENSGAGPEGRKTVALTRSLMVNTLYPLYHSFFTALGFDVVTAERPDTSGRLLQGAPFCFPVELSHGYAADLLSSNPDYIFLPQVKGLPATDGNGIGITCPLSQGEPYYLRPIFKELQDEKRTLTPVLDFTAGYDSQKNVFVEIGAALGKSRQESREAYRQAASKQLEVIAALKHKGEKVLAELEADPDKKGIVLFGRSYNAFTTSANMGIPHKFASRGLTILPCDFLPYEKEQSIENMYWASGQMIVQAARLVSRHPQLFGVYITNFSCGPDSFLINYFREIMGDKPSLTLELDNHTADAGLDTRIEAFLDIVEGYLEHTRSSSREERRRASTPRPRTALEKGHAYIQLPEGECLPLEDRRVKLLIPTMGEHGAHFFSSVIQAQGIRTEALPAPGYRELMLGRANSSCKECLPLQLTVGSLLRYLEDNNIPEGEQIVYFMPDASGPCRFGQYQVFINLLLDRLGIDNVTTLSLSAENSYGGLGTGFTMRAWLALVTSDVMHEIHNALIVLAKDKEKAMDIFYRTREQLAQTVGQQPWSSIKRSLNEAAAELAKIELTGSLQEAPKVALLGEIYVRHDGFSCQGLVEYLAEQGIVTKVAPINEWLYYCDYLLRKGLSGQVGAREKWVNRLRLFLKRKMEKEVKKALSASGLYHYHLTDVEMLMQGGERLISPTLTGEAILTVSSAIYELIDEAAGAIALGPFGCMPNRIAEAVTGKTVNSEKLHLTKKPELVKKVLAYHPHLPFMAIETDGSVFPQVVQARLESFVLQVRRLHQAMEKERCS